MQPTDRSLFSRFSLSPPPLSLFAIISSATRERGGSTRQREGEEDTPKTQAPTTWGRRRRRREAKFPSLSFFSLSPCSREGKNEPSLSLFCVSPPLSFFYPLSPLVVVHVVVVWSSLLSFLPFCKVVTPEEIMDKNTRAVMGMGEGEREARERD